MFKSQKQKKTQFPVIKTIIILIITSTVFLTYALILSKTNNINIRDQKLRTQLILNKIFTSKCFSTEYGIIDINSFTQKNIDLCFKNANIHDAAKIILKGKALYINQAEFDAKKDLCSTQTNLYCKNLLYPITLKENNKLINTELIVQTIIS